MINKFYYKKSIAFGKLDEEFNILTEKIGKLKIPKGFLQFIFYSIAELFANIKEHSKAKEILVKISIEKRKFITEINDNGIGLRKSYLRKGIIPKDDFSAIEFALAGLSTKSTRERGYGLYTIRKFIENLKGEIEIKTEKAKSTIRADGIQFKKIPEKKGTGVLLKAKIKDIDFYKILE